MVQLDKARLLALAGRAGITMTLEYAEKSARKVLAWQKEAMGGEYEMTVVDCSSPFDSETKP